MIFKKAYNFLANMFSSKNIKFTLAIIVGILIFLNLRTCSRLKDEKQERKKQEIIHNQNIDALTDTLKVVKNKLGEEESVKSAFIAENDQLKKLNNKLYNEVLKELGGVKSIIKSGVGINSDTLTISNTLVKYDDVTYGLQFDKEVIDTGFYSHISGVSKLKFENNTLFPDKTIISKNSIKVGLVYGFKEYEDRYEVFARSSSDRVSFDELDGALIINKEDDLTTPTVKKKRWVVGPSFSYGFTPKGFQPSFGVSITYGVIRF